MKRLVTLLAVVLSSNIPATEPSAEGVCEPPQARRYPALSRSLGITIDAQWAATHVESLHEAFAPGCQAYEGCLSVWGNPVDFCRLRLTMELREVCETRFDMSDDLRGWQQCRAVADVFSLAQRLPGQRAWTALQQRAAADAGAGGVASPEVSVEPAALEPGVGGNIIVRAFHPETGAPVYGLVTIEGVMRGPTFEPIEYALHFVRLPDELGRIALRMPDIAVEGRPDRASGAPPFAPVPVSFSTPVPENELELEPAQDRWVAGVNEVRVTARDSRTGEPLRGRVMRPGRDLGDLDRPVAIELRAGEAGLCGEPHWFRPDAANRPDTSLPIAPCR